MGKKRSSGSENIRVAIRCRDLLPFEAERGEKVWATLDLATNQVIAPRSVGDSDIFAFDAVYNNSFTQRDIFLQEVKPLADAVLQGYNSTVFAYGQSGSGKTHTMTGNLSDRQLWGMMPQVVDYLFKEMNGMTSATKTFKVRASYVEIYNGKSRDLLTSKQVNLEIKQNMSGNFYVKGAEMPEITCLEDAIRLFNAGTERRQVASTELNDTSSRSHALFTVQIEQFDFEQDPSAPVAMTSKINVVDLAGSEKLSKSCATGDTAKEGCNINLSLSALATVIDTIVKGGKYIPYRGSPLTMLLKDSLGGNAKTAMFANIGPSDRNSSETISTLRFALRAKQIENKPIKNIDPKDARIQELLDRIEELKGRIGNVDLNVEDNLRVRIEELEVENASLREMNFGSTLDLEKKLNLQQITIEEKNASLNTKKRELSKLSERLKNAEAALAKERASKEDLLKHCSEFITRASSIHEVFSLNEKLAKKNTRRSKEDGRSVKEIANYLQNLLEIFEKWRGATFTQEDMEKYPHRALSNLQDEATRQIEVNEHDHASPRKSKESENLDKFKVEIASLRKENDRLRDKIERDQAKIKAKLLKRREEINSLTEQLEQATAQNEVKRNQEMNRMKNVVSSNGFSTYPYNDSRAVPLSSSERRNTHTSRRFLLNDRNEKGTTDSSYRSPSSQSGGLSNTMPDVSSGIRLSNDLVRDEATIQRVVDVLVGQDEKILDAFREKEAMCERLESKLGKFAQVVDDLERKMEKEQNRFIAEKRQVINENETLRMTNTKLRDDIERLTFQLDMTKYKLSPVKDREAGLSQYGNSESPDIMLRTNYYSESSLTDVRTGYESLEQQMLRTEAALHAEVDIIRSNMQKIKQSSSLLDDEQKRVHDLERVIRDREMSTKKFSETPTSAISRKNKKKNRDSDHYWEDFVSCLSHSPLTEEDLALSREKQSLSMRLTSRDTGADVESNYGSEFRSRSRDAIEKPLFQLA